MSDHEACPRVKELLARHRQIIEATDIIQEVIQEVVDDLLAAFPGRGKEIEQALDGARGKLLAARIVRNGKESRSNGEKGR